MSDDPHLHDGHRERLKNAFLEAGLSCMPEHAVLELLLFYALPRKDTNPTAHRLINRFGSLDAVFSADFEELMSVEGVGKNVAAFIRLLPAVYERISNERKGSNPPVYDLEHAAARFVSYYRHKTEEEVTALLLDNADRFVGFLHVQQGSLNSTPLNLRRIMETALKRNAASLMLAHNHPSGGVEPSRADISATHDLLNAFIPLDLKLKAHFIVSGEECRNILPELYASERYEVRCVMIKADGEREGASRASKKASKAPPGKKQAKIDGNASEKQ